MASQTSPGSHSADVCGVLRSPRRPGGPPFWADSFDASADLTAQLAEFGNSQEFIDGFGTPEFV